jgi:hypothetical protein
MAKDDFKNPEKAEEVEEPEEVKTPSIFQLVEVPTQMGVSIQTPNGEFFDTNQLLVQLANDIQDIKQAVA